ARHRADAQARVRHELEATLARGDQGLRAPAGRPEEAQGAARLQQVRLHGPAEGGAAAGSRDQGIAEELTRRPDRSPKGGVEGPSLHNSRLDMERRPLGYARGDG